MRLRLTMLTAVMALVAGCGTPAPTTPARGGPEAKLPPEVEHDPATAAEKYKAAKKTPR